MVPVESVAAAGMSPTSKFKDMPQDYNANQGV